MNGDTRGIGDNRPPNDPLRVYLDDLTEVVKGPLAELNKLRQAQAERIPETFANVDQCKKGISLALMLGDLIDSVQILVDRNRKPLVDMNKLMSTNGSAWLMPSEDFYQQVRGKINAFMDAMPPGESLRTDYGELATRREVFKFEVIDAAQVPLQLKTPDDKYIKEWIASKTKGVDNAAALEDIIKDMAKQAPGIRVYRDPILTLLPGGKT